MRDKILLTILFIFGIISMYVLSISIIFGISMIPAMGIAWIIKTFFVVKYTFWQIEIAIAIAIGLSILGGSFKK